MEYLKCSQNEFLPRFPSLSIKKGCFVLSRDLLFTDPKTPPRWILLPQEVCLQRKPSQKYKIIEPSQPLPISHTHAHTATTLRSNRMEQMQMHTHQSPTRTNIAQNWTCRSELPLLWSVPLPKARTECWRQLTPGQLVAVTHFRGSSQSPVAGLGPTAGRRARWSFLGDDALCGFQKSLKARGVNLARWWSGGNRVCLSAHPVRAGGHGVVLRRVPLPVGC